jgi:Cys-tRNA synthase (O-phospho-L-seryl-tRNA:Cys-tRNA synthase)
MLRRNDEIRKARALVADTTQVKKIEESGRLPHRHHRAVRQLHNIVVAVTRNNRGLNLFASHTAGAIILLAEGDSAEFECLGHRGRSLIRFDPPVVVQ